MAASTLVVFAPVPAVCGDASSVPSIDGSIAHAIDGERTVVAFAERMRDEV